MGGARYSRGFGVAVARTRSHRRSSRPRALSPQEVLRERLDDLAEALSEVLGHPVEPEEALALYRRHGFLQEKFGPLTRHVPPAPPRLPRPPARAKRAASAPPPPAPPPPPPRRLALPKLGPEGAAVSLEAADLAGWLAEAGEARAGDLAIVRLAVDALAAEAEENFDKLLALEQARVDHYPHQIETALAVLKRFRGRVLLADEVGLGKTIEAGLVLSEYLLRGLVRRALVLTPAALVAQWQTELADKFEIRARSTLDPALRADPAAFFAQDGVVVASLATARAASYRDTLLAARFDLVLVDEAHHVKNRATRGWELVNALRSQFLLLLTATPIETDLGELYNLVTLLRPGTLGTEAEFRRRFTRKGDPLAPKDPEELRALLREVMVRNTRAAAGVELPPRTVRTQVVEPLPGERALYEALVELSRRVGRGREHQLVRLLLEEAGSSPAAVARTAAAATPPSPELAAELRRIAELARRVGAGRKLEWLLEAVPGGKLLVFTRFRATHELLVAELERRGIPCASFHGGLSAAARVAEVERFRGSAEVMVCSEVGGEGQNLQFCHRMLNYDLPWNPMLIEQRIGRLHRIGQTEPVEIVNLCTGGTAEERILEVLDQRVNLFELVVGELDMILGEVDDEREFGEQVFEIYAASADESAVLAGFEALGDRLAGARDGLERAKGAAEAAFGDALGA